MTRAFTRHARLSHSERLESFNRASHSDALREMQLVEPVTPIVGTGTQYLPAMGMALTFILVGML